MTHPIASRGVGWAVSFCKGSRTGWLWRYLVAWTMVLGMSVSTAQGWRLCEFCDFETPVHLTHCRQCGQAPKVAGEPAAPEVAEPSLAPETEPGERLPRNRLVSDAMIDDVRLALAQVAAGRPDVALGLFRNAMALLTLLPADTGASERTQRLLQWERECLMALQHVNRRCTACEGSGRARLRIQSLQGLTDEPSSLAAGPGTCLPCRGSGSVAAQPTLAELLAVLRNGRSEADRLQQLNGRRSCGGAWVPEPVLNLIGIRDEAGLRRAAAAPCVACGGLRLEDCRPCSGAGTTPCRHPNCREGWVAQTWQGNDGLLQSQRTELRRRCPVCNGSMLSRCDACEGRGGVPCRQCGGSGQRAPCNTCGGEGLSLCRRCQGGGTVREAVCTTCRGEGVMLCGTCGGDGRMRR